MTLAVLTGDLIGSARLGAAGRDRALLALGAAADAIDWAGGPLHFTRQRGDGWQVVIARPEMALRSALVLRAALRALGKNFATRIALATGDGWIPPSGDLNAAHGDAFTASGRGLDGLATATLVHVSGGALGAATILADHVSSGWTPPQARAAARALVPDPPANRAIAARLGISRQAVDQALRGAGLAALRPALEMIEAEKTS